jgi:hypothetical protein
VTPTILDSFSGSADFVDYESVRGRVVMYYHEEGETVSHYIKNVNESKRMHELQEVLSKLRTILELFENTKFNIRTYDINNFLLRPNGNLVLTDTNSIIISNSTELSNLQLKEFLRYATVNWLQDAFI